MPALALAPRGAFDDIGNARNTFSSWDSCMSEAYCKWPAIVGIIIGSLIVISIIWCCARCLCCGAECCCGCLSCCNACCPSPRKKSKDGYQQTPQPQYSQYQSPAPTMYYGGGYAPPQTATFDAPSYSRNAKGEVGEDSLPAMPSWQTAQSRRVEEEHDLEMEKLDHNSGQQQSLLSQSQQGYNDQFYNHAQRDSGDIGAMHASPYNDYAQQHDYSQHQQFAGSVGSPTTIQAPSMYPPTYHTRPASSVYEPQSAGPYGAPPSYRTGPPSVVSPPQQHARMNSFGNGNGIGRKPVQGTWREV